VSSCGTYGLLREKLSVSGLSVVENLVVLGPVSPVPGVGGRVDSSLVLIMVSSAR